MALLTGFVLVSIFFPHIIYASLSCFNYYGSDPSSATSVTCLANQTYCSSTGIYTTGQSIYIQECRSNCTNSSYIPGIFSTSCCQTNNCNNITTKAIVNSCYQGLSVSSSFFGSLNLNLISQSACKSPNNQYCGSITANSSFLNTRVNAYLCLSVCKPESINGLSMFCCQSPNCNVPSISSKTLVPIQLLISILISLIYFI